MSSDDRATKGGGDEMAITIQLPSGQHVIVNKDTAVIGRDDQCDICLPDHTGLAPRHARIRKVADRWLIESLGDWKVEVRGSEPSRMAWLNPGDGIWLTESGPQIYFEPSQNCSWEVKPALEQKLRSVPPALPKPRTVTNLASNTNHEDLGDSVNENQDRQRTSPPPLPRLTETKHDRTTSLPYLLPSSRGNRQQSAVIPDLPVESRTSLSHWFIVKSERESGPYTSAQMKQLAASGHLKTFDQVRRADLKTHVTAEKIQGWFLLSKGADRPRTKQEEAEETISRDRRTGTVGSEPTESDRQAVTNSSRTNLPSTSGDKSKQPTLPATAPTANPDISHQQSAKARSDVTQSPDRAWHTMMGTWVFGTLLFLFFIVVFALGPNQLPAFKQRMLAVSCGLLASLFAYFLTGELKLKLPGIQGVVGEKSRATGGVAIFVLVLLWWTSPLAPIGMEQKVDAIKEDTTQLLLTTQHHAKLLTSITNLSGNPEGLIPHPKSEKDYLSNASAYEKRRDFANARKSFEEYLHREQADLYDSYSNYWGLLKVEFSEGNRVRDLFIQLANSKPNSKAAKLVLLVNEHSPDAVQKIREFVGQNPEYLPAYRELYDRMTKDTISEEEEADHLRIEFQERGGYESARQFFLDPSSARLTLLKEFGRETPLDNTGRASISYEFDAYIQLLLITILEKSPPKQISLKFPNGPMITVPCGQENPFDPNEPVVAFALMPGDSIRFEPRNASDRRDYPHCGTLYGIGSSAQSVEVSYMDYKGRTYAFSKPLVIKIPAFQTEVLDVSDGLLIDRTGPVLRITPLQTLQSCEISMMEDGPFVSVPPHGSVPTLCELPLKHIPGLPLEPGPHVVWVRGVTSEGSRRVGPEQLSITIPDGMGSLSRELGAAPK